MNQIWKVLFGLAMVVVLVLDFVRERVQPDAFWDMPLFFMLMGLLGTAALTFLAKGALSKVLDRDDDYYEPYGITEREATGQGAEREGSDVW